MNTHSRQDLLSLTCPEDVTKQILNYAPHHPTALILKQVVTRIDEDSGHGFLVKYPAPAHARKRNNIVSISHYTEDTRDSIWKSKMIDEEQAKRKRKSIAMQVYSSLLG